MDKFAHLRHCFLLPALLFSAGVSAATWQPVGSGSEKIDIDRSRIQHEPDGRVMVWSRLVFAQVVVDGEGHYNSIEALNRYDCAGRQFATVKRLYLFDKTLVRVEPVLQPHEVAVAAAGADSALISELCPRQIAAQSVVAPPSLTAKIIAVSESAATKPISVPAQRFITLPRIDPSLLQHPTDEPKPAEIAKHAEAAAAIRSEAAKAGVALEPKHTTPRDRMPLELALATTGLHKEITIRHSSDDAQSELDGRNKRIEAHRDIHWSYEGDGAPAQWAKLKPDYNQCETSQRQSPIDIRDGIKVDLEPIKFDYRSSPFRVVDNGHTVQVNFDEGNRMSVMGRSYHLLQLHFHRPSEERVNGRGFDMVMHMVHKDDDGRLAVVAVLLERGAEHPLIQTFWNNLPLETNVELAPATAIDPNKLLPEARAYYTFMGSLTTPPCSDGVLWMVLKQPLQISEEQIAIFSRLYKNNARPLQAANGRLIKESR